MSKYTNLKLAHNIGDISHSNYHTREQIINCKDPIGFDGIYKSVYDNQDCLEGKSGLFFVMGNYVGKDNSFEYPAHVPKLEKYCTWEEIKELSQKYDFEIAWHTWSHPDLTTLSRSDIVKEITPPYPMNYFAYPYGRYNNMVVDVVKECGYKMAWSVTQGVQDTQTPFWQYKIHRNYIK